MPHDFDVGRVQRGQRQTRAIWRVVSAVAGRQHGVLSRAQLVDLGLSTDRIDRMIGFGELHRLYRGVYAVGHDRISRHGRWMAAVFAGGKGSALSHDTAGMNWELLSPTSSVPRITTPTARRRREGIRFHTAQLEPDEITIHNGIPTTTIARTILDLAAITNPHRVERAIAEAEYRGLTDPVGLPTLLERYPGRRGTRALREILKARLPERGVTKEALEARFLPFLDRNGLSRPELNAPLELQPGSWIKVDCLWLTQRVALEHAPR